MRRTIATAAAALGLMWANSALSATTITFDNGEAPLYQSNAGLVSEGIHFGASYQWLVGGGDRAVLGAQRIQPFANNWQQGGGTFDIHSLDIKLVDHGGGVKPTTLNFKYWRADPTEGEGNLTVLVGPEAFTSFQTIDLSSLGTIRALDFGFGGVRVFNTPTSPCYSTTPCILQGNYTLTDNIVISNVVSDAALGVPEPSAWAMMLAGFALAGTFLRSAQSRRSQISRVDGPFGPAGKSTASVRV